MTYGGGGAGGGIIVLLIIGFYYAIKNTIGPFKRATGINDPLKILLDFRVDRPNGGLIF